MNMLYCTKKLLKKVKRDFFNEKNKIASRFILK
jgi:hypothetical protein